MDRLFILELLKAQILSEDYVCQAGDIFMFQVVKMDRINCTPLSKLTCPSSETKDNINQSHVI